MTSLTVIDTETLYRMLKEAVNAGIKEFLPYPSPVVDGNSKRVYTRNEVANILKCTPNTVTKYIRQGKLHATPLNGQYRINEKQLQDFIENKRK